MNLEVLFSIASLLAMVGWLFLLASPFVPQWSDRIAGFIIPATLSVGYVVVAVFLPGSGDGGFGSLADVTKLFSRENAVLAGWIHFLAFDLLVGAWACRTARREGLRFMLVVPCLLLMFFLGPAGFLAFVLIRLLTRKSGNAGGDESVV